MTIPLPSFLTGQLWKLATAAAGVLTLALTVLLGVAYMQNRDLSKQREVLSASINDPETGYIAKLSQARTNEAQLKVVIERQNAAYDKLSAESKAQLTATKAQLVIAQAETKRMELRLHNFLATKPQGATLEDRVRDIDERGLSEMVK